MRRLSGITVLIAALLALMPASTSRADYQLIYEQQDSSESDVIKFDILFQSTDLWFQADIGIYNNILDEGSYLAGTLESFEINPELYKVGVVSYTPIVDMAYYHLLQIQRTAEIDLDTPILLATISINTSNYDPTLQYYTDASSSLTVAYSDPELQVQIDRTPDILFGTFFEIPAPGTLAIFILLKTKRKRRTLEK